MYYVVEKIYNEEYAKYNDFEALRYKLLHTTKFKDLDNKSAIQIESYSKAYDYIVKQKYQCKNIEDKECIFNVYFVFNEEKKLMLLNYKIPYAKKFGK